MKAVCKNQFLWIVLIGWILAGVPAMSQPAMAADIEGKLPVFIAGSLTVPFKAVSKEYNKHYPKVDVLIEGGGSATTIRKVTELKREGGVIGSADYKIVPKLMFPDYADWYIVFASNQMVLCYTEKSKYAKEVNADNWHEILPKEGVMYGRSDPDQDPCGYRTLMVWQLAEKHYGVSGIYKKLYGAKGDTMRAKSVDLIALLQSGDLDYAFEYSSVARQHGLKFLQLPEQINLSSAKHEAFYAHAKVSIKGKKPGETIDLTGEPILYAVTIPKNYPDQKKAQSFVEFLLSEKGLAALEATGQDAVRPAVASDKNKLPTALQKYVQ
ncbi:MAG TPA: tungstate ABC transporter substrate-binding protein WtpA [Smithellaceae bacterium]|mgnify:CR=1 FL=1|nr:tungstate ABC transporter substrate-binding protein WtpA [Smithellaceae bacterium]